MIWIYVTPLCGVLLRAVCELFKDKRDRKSFRNHNIAANGSWGKTRNSAEVSASKVSRANNNLILQDPWYIYIYINSASDFLVFITRLLSMCTILTSQSVLDSALYRGCYKGWLYVVRSTLQCSVASPYSSASYRRIGGIGIMVDKAVL